ncbi:DUF6916 family protein [Marinicella meishanensis]|uniref:DUF6916 family protein n=1 Tax=Marinicella meishanensis TaxID=2873263 RepID=UPI001CBD4D27|nr:hypothetical protein [Marinicella sp. NBU2979]
MNIPSRQQFEQHQQDEFVIQFNAMANGSCRIQEITVSNGTPNALGEKQFSVVFSHPEPVVYEQGVYPVRHKQLGDFDLFLVPIFGDDNQVHYEAVFS